MLHPTRPALTILRPAALRAVPSPRLSECKSMSSAAALSIEDGPSPAFDLHILDIFDAPARLGESSRLLALNAASSSSKAGSRSARALSTLSNTARRRPAVKPLPAPILFDGPARPRGMSKFAASTVLRLRAQGRATGDKHASASQRRHLGAAGASGVVACGPAPLPAPELFDGPSQLRPYSYARGRSWEGSNAASVAVKSVMPLVLALAAGFVLFGVDLDAAPKTEGRSHDSARRKLSAGGV